MIVIQTIESDISTAKVLDWLYFFGIKDIVRINGNCKVSNITLDNSEFVGICLDNEAFLKLKKKSYNYWYRRGVLCETIDFSGLSNYTLFNFYKENEAFLNLMLPEYSNKSIGKFSDNNIDKITQLIIAKSVGLDIPITYVTNKPTSILKSSKKIITKAIHTDCFKVSFSDKFDVTANLPTTHIHGLQLNNTETGGRLCQYQEYVEKRFEIRTFIVENHFFSTAIFSQSNQKTKFDYKHIDKEKPNRLVPFSLPQKLKKKLIQLFKKLNLTSGSVDMIYTEERKFIFLEVNPIGQYEWIAVACNFSINKTIAEILRNNYNHE